MAVWPRPCLERPLLRRFEGMASWVMQGCLTDAPVPQVRKQTNEPRLQQHEAGTNASKQRPARWAAGGGLARLEPFVMQGTVGSVKGSHRPLHLQILTSWADFSGSIATEETK